ncbi:MAG: hypothetical protein L7U72_15055 [Rubripirellula sp.]|nr:hypothetical protein [Rubripirellula sp.]
MKKTALLWLVWLLCPAFALTFHYGPGQVWLARDRIGEKISLANARSMGAAVKQEMAYRSQIEVLEARRLAFVEGVDWQSEPDHPVSISVRDAEKRQETLYQEAADEWSGVTMAYTEAIKVLIESLGASVGADDHISDSDQDLLESLRWAEARGMVRSGLVFNGVDQLQALLDLRGAENEAISNNAMAVSNRGSSWFATEGRRRISSDVIREELAAALYVGARLLREEGRSPELWRPVSNAARQHFRYLAEKELASEDSVRSVKVGEAGDLQEIDQQLQGTDAMGAVRATGTETVDLPTITASEARQDAASPLIASQRPTTEESGSDQAVIDQAVIDQAEIDQAEIAQTDADGQQLSRAERIQRNLEQVLNLEQSSSEQLEGIPLPRQAPMARRPGDGQPGDRPGRGPGRGPLQDGPPGEGAGIPGPFGSGW